MSPTEEPITPTDEPTETVTPTEEPTPTPDIDYELDRDLDGLPDYVEDQIGTDPLKADTDDDELSDYIEIMIGYDPTNPDSDGNEITDGNEDFDNDSLSNTQELQLGSELCYEDSDGDYLIDGDEIYIYGTDPLVPDTDGDGISDGDEVAIEKNPTDCSDGATRITQSFTQIINNEEDRAITSVDVTLSVANKIDRVLDVNDYYNVDVYSTGVYGRIGSPLNFECDDDFDTANVVIHYDETALGDALEENLGVLWFDEETGFYITQEQALIDTTNNKVTLVLEHFSTYVLVDLSKWNNPPITPLEPLSLSCSVRTVRYETIGVYYDAFPIYEQNEAGEWVDTGRFYGGTIAPERNERNAWNQYLSSHPNDVCIETVSVGHYILFGGLRYTYTWLVSTSGYEDNDQDGVPDTFETNGIFAYGQNELYTSRIDEGGADSDGDTVPDLEEYRAVFIISKSSEDGSISVTRISTNGQEILESNSRLYELALSYVDDILGSGETFAFCVPRSNPMEQDTDLDDSRDDVDAYPLRENPLINYIICGIEDSSAPGLYISINAYKTLFDNYDMDCICITIQTKAQFEDFWESMKNWQQEGDNDAYKTDKEYYRGVDNLIFVCHGNYQYGIMFNPNRTYPNAEDYIYGDYFYNIRDNQSAHINVVDFLSCYSAYDTNFEDSVFCPAEGVVTFCDVDVAYGYCGLSRACDILRHSSCHLGSDCDGYYCFARNAEFDEANPFNPISSHTRVEPDTVDDITIWDTALSYHRDTVYYYDMIRSRASAGE